MHSVPKKITARLGRITLKSIFSKVGVHSPGELVARLRPDAREA